MFRWPKPVYSETRITQYNTYTIDSDNADLTLGTLVVCHGMNDSVLVHLNGQIGDVRKPEGKEGEGNGVHFEDANLEPCVSKIKQENLRILFQFPPK